MNFQRIALAAVAAWIASLGVGFFVNDFLLADVLFANRAAMRPDADLTANLPVGFVVLLVGFFAFAYAFAKGYEGTDGVMEGIRFGVLTGIVILGFANIWTWVAFPIDGAMGTAIAISSIAEPALYGAIIGAIYRPLEEKTAGRRAAV